MQHALGNIRQVRALGLTLLALTSLTGCGASRGPATVTPSSSPTTPSSSPTTPSNEPSNPPATFTTPSSSPIGGPAGSTFAGTFRESPGGYDSSVAFNVSLGTPVETQDINDAPDVFRLELPFTASFSVTNLTNRNAPQDGSAQLKLFFKSSRPICDKLLGQQGLGGTVQLTKPNGSYCYMTVFNVEPEGVGQAAPNDSYQLSVKPVIFSTNQQLTVPNQTMVYLLDEARVKLVVAELSKGPDMMAILSSDAANNGNCGVDLGYMAVSISYFVASTEDPVVCVAP
jgi:predicted small lipoprotein YifL